MRILSIIMLFILVSCSPKNSDNNSTSSPKIPEIIKEYEVIEDETLPLNLSNYQGYTIEKIEGNSGTITGDLTDLSFLSNIIGDDVFKITLKKGSETLIVSVKVTVIIKNHAPQAFDQIVYIEKGNGLLFDLNFTDEDNDQLTITLLNYVSRGNLFFDFDNKMGYDSEDDEYQAVFQYKVSDGKLDSNVATVTINVTRENEAPQLTINDSLTIEEDSQNTSLPYSTIDLDEDDVFTTIVSQPQSGSIVLGTDEFLYTPNENFNGSDSFTFKVFDNYGGIVEKTITLNVTPKNDAPNVQNISVQLDEDHFGYVIPLEGADIDGDSLTYSITQQPNKGIVSIDSQGNITYIPNLDETGPDIFSYKANDGQLDSNVGVITVGIIAQTEAPIATSKTFDLMAGEIIDFELEGTTEDYLTQWIVDSNPFGGVLVQEGKFLRYESSLEFSGIDTITFRVMDSQGRVSEQATIIFNVVAANWEFLTYNEIGDDFLSSFIDRNASDLVLNSFNKEFIVHRDENDNIQYSFGLSYQSCPTIEVAYHYIPLGKNDLLMDYQTFTPLVADCNLTTKEINKVDGNLTYNYSFFDDELSAIQIIDDNFNKSIFLGMNTNSSNYFNTLTYFDTLVMPNEVNYTKVDFDVSNSEKGTHNHLTEPLFGNVSVNGSTVKLIQLKGSTITYDDEVTGEEIIAKLYTRIDDDNGDLTLRDLYLYEEDDFGILTWYKIPQCEVFNEVTDTCDQYTSDFYVGDILTINNKIILSVRYYLERVAVDSNGDPKDEELGNDFIIADYLDMNTGNKLLIYEY